MTLTPEPAPVVTLRPFRLKADGNGKAPPADAISGDLVTEDAAALAFVARYADRLRYCHDTGAWFEWNGALWRQNRTGLAFQWSRELARELVAAEDDRIRYVASRTSFAAGVEKFARTDHRLAVTMKFWDQDAFALGTPDGTVDLRTGTAMQPDPASGISKATAVAPAGEAACPLWRQFLEETTGGDVELMRFLQQFAGYSLTGDVREHVLLFGYGSGGNGKSVFVNTLTGILADYATTAAMDTFAASHGTSHPTEIAMLRGARLVTASETEEGRAWAEARIKAITGGDQLSARFMRQDFFSFVPTFKLLIVGNHKPVLRNIDEATRRRFCIVPFTRKPTQPDRQLETKLKAEWPAILRWMIDGCLDWQQHGLVRPGSVRAATADYFAAQDVLGQWLADECDCEPDNPYKTATSAELFIAWSAYAKASGEDAGSRRAFGDAMQRRGFEAAKSNALGRHYKGIQLLRRRTEQDA